MNDISYRFVQAFSWMLVHSVWQAMCIALLSCIVLLVCKNKKAATKYTILLISFSIFIVSSLFTFYYQWNVQATLPLNSISDTIEQLNPQTAISSVNIEAAGFLYSFNHFLSANASVIVLIWFLIFLYQLTRTIIGLSYMQQVRYKQVSSPSADWIEKFTKMANGLHLTKKIQFLASAYIKTPVTIGYFKPVVLLPMGILTSLPPAQLEAILLHELAHIRRHDYLVNMIQVITENIFFFNPGFRWISSSLRELREYCCDDIALEKTKDKKQFINALLNIKLSGLQNETFTMAFLNSKKQLYKRVNRIAFKKTALFSSTDKTFFLSGIITLLTIMLINTEIKRSAALKGFTMSSQMNWKQPVHLPVIDNKKPKLIKKDTEDVLLSTNINSHSMMMPDSSLLSELTGEFNTTWKNTKYRFGIADSKITSLYVNDAAIPVNNWPQFNEAMTAIVTNFKEKQEQLKALYP